MDKISMLNNNLINKNKNKPVTSSYNWMNFESLLPEKYEVFRKNLRIQLEKEVKPLVVEYTEKAEYPEKIVEIFKKLDLGKYYLSKPYGEGVDHWYFILITIELSRIDGSLATFFIVHCSLFMHTLDRFGSKEQKDLVLYKARSFDIIGGWALTENKIGSDASRLSTTIYFDSNKNKYILNGDKRWIGNANKDYIIVQARDLKDNQIKSFLLDLTSKGVKREVIKHKISLRAVQNMQLYFENVEIDVNMKLPKANSFKDVNIMLEHSRLFVIWVAVGFGLGIYDHCIEYISKRNQFKKPISSFQLIQEKLVRIMGKVQTSLLFAKRITDLYYSNNITIGKIALGKAFITLNIREAASLAREMLGGNGIILDNFLAKAFVDMEAIYTFEGTYDINCLITGRELTGYQAFK